MKLRKAKGGGDISKMSPQAQAFYKELYSMTKNDDVIAQIDVKYGSSEINTGNYIKNAIDVADINQFDDLGKGLATKQGKLTHELVEQFEKAASGYKKGQDGGYSYNHPKGINAENRVNMSYRDNAERTVGRRVYQQKYTRNGMTRYYNINTNNPIIKVSKSLNR